MSADLCSLERSRPAPFGRFSLEAGARLYREYTGKTPLYAGQCAVRRRATARHRYGAATFSIEQIDPSEAQAEPSKAPSAQPPSVTPVLTAPNPIQRKRDSSTKIGGKPECVTCCSALLSANLCPQQSRPH